MDTRENSEKKKDNGNLGLGKPSSYPSAVHIVFRF